MRCSTDGCDNTGRYADRRTGAVTCGLCAASDAIRMSDDPILTILVKSLQWNADMATASGLHQISEEMRRRRGE